MKLSTLYSSSFYCFVINFVKCFRDVIRILSWSTYILSLFLSPAKAIDEYASLKSKAAESNSDGADVDPRLEAIVERLLDK